MNRMKQLIAAGLAMLAAFVSQTLHATSNPNLIVNGDFEATANVSSGDHTYISSGATSAPWKALRMYMTGFIHSSTSLMHDDVKSSCGTYAAFLQTHSEAGDQILYQDVTVPEAGTYAFSVKYAARNGGYNGNTFTFSLGGTRLYQGSTTEGSYWQTFTCNVYIPGPGVYRVEVKCYNNDKDQMTFFDDFSLVKCDEEDAAIENGTTIVTVEDSVRGLSGTGAGTTTFTEDTQTFTAPESVTDSAGRTWQPNGYKLERFDVSGEYWIVEKTGTEATVTIENGGEGGQMRLTWNWKLADGVLAYDADYYVPNGLLLHFDAIRNAGLTAAHSTSATEWANLGTAGGSATRITKDESKGLGAWSDTAYEHTGGTYFETPSITLKHQATVQIGYDMSPSTQTTRYPTYFGMKDDYFQLYTDGSSAELIFKQYHANANPRPAVKVWDGSFATAYVCGNRAGMGDGKVAPPMTFHSKSNAIGSASYYFGGGSGQGGTRELTGSTYTLRVYDRILTTEEVARNRELDNLRFLGRWGESTETDLVTVCMSHKIAEAECETGSWLVRGNGTKTVTAPETVTTADGYVWTLKGYLLETMDTEARTVAYEEVDGVSSYTFTATESGANRRLTWRYEMTTGIRGAADYGVGDYVLNGLLANFDGINNEGPARPHNNAAPEWVNSGSLGGNAWFNCSKFHSWSDLGCVFSPNNNGWQGACAWTKEEIKLGTEFTIQGAVDFATGGQTASYPTLCGMPNDSGLYGKGSIQWKLNDGSMTFFNGGRPSMNWSGKYYTGILTPTTCTLTEGTTIPTSGNGYKTGTAYERPAQMWSIGGSGTNPGGTESRHMKGTTYAFRLYNRALTEAELVHNRRIDEIRFRGMPSADVLVVADGDYAPTEAPGAYNVYGEWTFTARPKTDDGRTYIPLYKVATKNDAGEWVDGPLVQGGSYTYNPAAGAVRLTWIWGEPYARYDVGSGWRFCNPDGSDITESWSGGVTSDIEVRIYSYDEYVAVKDAGVSPSRFAVYGTIQVPDGVDSLDMTTCFDVLAEGGAIDLNGKSVTISGFNGEGTITDTSSGTPGELHVATADGSVENSTITLTGNLKLVVEGGGTFTASKASQSYTGGTVVSNGTAKVGTVTHPFGDGNASQTITLGENAVFDFNANINATTCCYNFELYEGSQVATGNVKNTRWIRHFGSLTLFGDATFKALGTGFFGGSSESTPSTVTLNNHTLYLDLNEGGDGNLRDIKTLDAGTMAFINGYSTYYGRVDFSTASVKYIDNGFFYNGNSGILVGDLYFDGTTQEWRSQNTTSESLVYGRYLAGDFRAPFTMQSGSTIDLSQVTGPWNADGQALAKGTFKTAGLVTFLSASASYTVDIGARDVQAGDCLVQFASSYTPDPSVSFTLAATGASATPAERKIGVAVEAGSDGVYCLVVKSIEAPAYARWDLVDKTWKFYLADGTAYPDEWTEITGDVEIHFSSYAEYDAIRKMGVAPKAYVLNGTVTLDDSWDMTACLDYMAEGTKIDLNGKTLTVASLSGAAEVTDTSTGGVLCLTVAEGTSLENKAVTLSGNLKLVVKGGGTFTASKASQSYTGGTEVESGTTIAAGVTANPFGDNSRTITLKENAVYSVSLSGLTGTSCRYNFVLYDGSAIQAGDFNNRWVSLFGTMELKGDASFSGGTKSHFGGVSSSHSEITLNGHTLSVASDTGDDPNMGYVKTLDVGTINFTANYFGMHASGSDFTTVTVEYSGTGYANLGDYGMSVSNLVYNAGEWINRKDSAVINVYGNYQAGTPRPPIKMQDGSTLDLSNCNGLLSASGTANNNGVFSATESNGALSFAAGAEIKIDVGERKDLFRLSRSDTPYLVTWAGSKPDATFTMVNPRKGYRIEADDKGLRLFYNGGMHIIVR